MIVKPKISGSTIAYQLRHRKAIERNIFITILKKLDRFQGIDIHNYRYVGFGAASLEDFKALHAEFAIDKMDCIEGDNFAFTRQVFNNPYEFIKLFQETSTEYITNGDFKQDLSQIIWWDFAEPKSIRQQLRDIELTAEKVSSLDILKFTFNSEITSFLNTHNRDQPRNLYKHKNLPNYHEVLKFLSNDPTYKIYFPVAITVQEIENDFSTMLRAMAIRAVKRGLSKAFKNLEFHHLASFTYSDGQMMTTITGIITPKDIFPKILKESGLSAWEFYTPDKVTEVIPAVHIEVPVMTFSERAEIDKQLHHIKPDILAKNLQFKYGTDIDEHIKFIRGYCQFYRYLPYYSKIIY